MERRNQVLPDRRVPAGADGRDPDGDHRHRTRGTDHGTGLGAVRPAELRNAAERTREEEAGIRRRDVRNGAVDGQQTTERLPARSGGSGRGKHRMDQRTVCRL